MKKLLSRFWRDEAGFVISSELVLVATILVIGMIAGLSTVQDQVVQELGDTAQAVANINQSYQYFGTQAHTSATAGSTFQDNLDFCDAGNDPNTAAPACMVMTLPGAPEASGLPAVSAP
jgi:Flp pilus assembly pilin Flp